MLNFILNALFPEKSGCLLCGKEAQGSEGVCKSCQDQFRTGGMFFCPVCGRYWAEFSAIDLVDQTELLCDDCLRHRTPYFAARSLGPYGGVLKDGIYKFKYQGNRSMSQSFGLLLAELFLRERIFFGTNLIVPVPLSREKEIERGFNQSNFLAQKIGRLLGTSVQNCLIKTRHTPSQSKLTRKARRENVAGAYEVIPEMTEELRGKKVLLIDDIFTTGATVNECAGVLLKAGADRVGVMTLASATLEKRGQA